MKWQYDIEDENLQKMNEDQKRYVNMNTSL